MDMGEMIRRRRTALGMTQEQVAQRLGVTAPAVNKWERGVTCPDIGLLPALARLLETDVNALFSFRTEPDAQERGRAMLAVAQAADAAGLTAAMREVEHQLRVWPRSDQLRWDLSLVLEGKCAVADVPEPVREECRQTVTALWEQVARSDDAQLRHRAEGLLVSRCLSRQDVTGAEEVLRRIPEGEAQDRRLLQANVLQAQGRTEEAQALRAASVLTMAGALYMALMQLLEAEEDDGRARELASRLSQLCALLDMNPVCGLSAEMTLALRRQDATVALDLLERILRTVQIPWSVESSVLYRYAKTRAASMAGMAQAILREVEADEHAAFLREAPGWEALKQAFGGEGAQV